MKLAEKVEKLVEKKNGFLDLAVEVLQRPGPHEMTG
jgi:hypothetical protein